MTLNTCRSCNSSNLEIVLDMGQLPLAGDFKSLGIINELYPLSILVCANCGLLQVEEIVDSSILFHSSYSYSSSTIPGLVRHFEEYAASKALSSSEKKRVLEIGCNDGVFLEPLCKAGYEVVGVDASDNVASMARSKGLDVHTGLFNQALAETLGQQYGTFDIITCSNVFAHNPDVNSFIAAVDKILGADGEFWIEVHSAHELYTGLQWDCFYHEHCFYWTIHALTFCLQQHGFELREFKTTPMHGGALRAVFSRVGEKVLLSEEELTSRDWQHFGTRCLRSREIIHDSINALPLNFAYGAAGRAVTLINWAQIAESLEWVVDGSPLRFNRAIPGTQVPVISEDEFFKKSAPDWCFVTAHNYLEGIKQKVETHFPDHSIKFVTPLPNVQIL